MNIESLNLEHRRKKERKKEEEKTRTKNDELVSPEYLHEESPV